MKIFRNSLLALGLCCGVPAIADIEEVSIDHKGQSLVANLSLAGQKSLADGLVLVLHGTLAHKDMEIISALQATLDEAGYSSLTITLSLNVNERRGFYPCERPHTHQKEDSLTELQAWIGWLNEQGAGQITLLGHSLGANQAARFAEAHADSISRVVLLAPPSQPDPVDNENLQALINTAEDGWLIDKDFLHCKSAKVTTASYLSYFGPDADRNTLPLIAAMQIPTLVVSGSEDDGHESLIAGLRLNSNKMIRQVEVEGAGHFFRDLYMYDVVDAMDSFMRLDNQ